MDEIAAVEVITPRSQYNTHQGYDIGNRYKNAKKWQMEPARMNK